MKKSNQVVEDIINLCLNVPRNCKINLSNEAVIRFSLDAEEGKYDCNYSFMEITFRENKINLINLCISDDIFIEEDMELVKEIRNIIAKIMKLAGAKVCYHEDEDGNILDVDEGFFDLTVEYDELLSILKGAFGTKKENNQIMLS